jgi:hypothetical protein
VAFVYLHAGTPFAKKGEMAMSLPKMDVPVNVVEWELFVPDRYRANRFDGNAIAADLLESNAAFVSQLAGGVAGAAAASRSDAVAHLGGGYYYSGTVVPGQIVGRVVDSGGSPLPGATIVVEAGGQQRTAIADANGWYTFAGLPSGPIKVNGQLDGFKTVQRSLVFDQRARQMDFQLAPGGAAETVTVTAEAPLVNTQTSQVGRTFTPNEMADKAGEGAARRQSGDRDQRAAENEAPSLNVQSLQRRAAGVLPVRIDVPRAGTSHRFVKPLVIDEETVVSFQYRRR